MLEAGATELVAAETGEDAEGVAVPDPDLGADTETEAEAVPEAEAEGDAGADVPDAVAEAVAEAVPEGEPVLTMGLEGMAGTIGTAFVGTTGVSKRLEVMNDRVTGIGRTVTTLIGCGETAFWAGAGFNSLASWLNANPIPFCRRSLPTS